jgi:hypothetical protein
MVDFLHKYAKNVTYSQNGEEGILIECLNRMKIKTGHAVEVGANNGAWCSNTALLVEKGWTCKMVEGDFNLWKECSERWKANQNVTTQCSMVDKYNVNAFVDGKCDVLSIDTDGQDYEIFKALKSKPKIVIVEIDSSILPHEDRFNDAGGAGYKRMVELGTEKGYFLLVHTGNLVFVDNQYKKLFPEISGDPLYNSEKYFNRSWINEAA